MRWSHGSRFRLARELVAPFAGQQLLDYGCGDGTFLALVQDLFPAAVGVDVDAKQLVDCVVRFAGAPGIEFFSTSDLTDPRHRDRYGIVACMEVLEHCPDDVQVTVLDQIVNATMPGGTVVISVPIEIGPPLLAKQGARALVALRGLSEVRHPRALSAGRARAHAVCRCGDGVPARRVPRATPARGSPGTKGSTGAGCSAQSSGASSSSDACSRRCRFSARG